MYVAASTLPPDPAVRRSQRLIMGPWAHLQPFSRPTTSGGDIDFGADAAIELLQIERAFFDRTLRDIRPTEDEAPVRMFVMGINRWRDEDAWPLARAKPARWYLRAGGLSRTRPDADAPDNYVFDPADPVPTHGGNLIGPDAGVRDQRLLAARTDLLHYCSSPLGSPVEVSGAVSVELFAASSAPDTDFVARLVDVHADGFEQNVLDGIVRARFRDGRGQASPLVPDRPERYLIDLWSTSHVFKAGHRIRVDVTSSNFPRYDRNPNSGLPLGTDVSLHKARQTIFHDEQRPSCIVLPVVPN
jgi:hypothetical protein